MGIDADILKEFLWSTHEDLEVLEADLNTLAKEPAGDVINSIYRHFHSLKGSAGLVGLAEFERAAHACENMLSGLRDNLAAVDADVVHLLGVALDAVKWYIVALEKGDEVAGVFDELMDGLRGLEERLLGGAQPGEHHPAESGAMEVSALAEPGDQEGRPAVTHDATSDFTQLARYAELNDQPDRAADEIRHAVADADPDGAAAEASLMHTDAPPAKPHANGTGRIAAQANGTGRIETQTNGTGRAQAPANGTGRIAAQANGSQPQAATGGDGSGARSGSAAMPPAGSPAVGPQSQSPAMADQPGSLGNRQPVASDTPAAAQAEYESQGKVRPAPGDTPAGASSVETAVRVDIGLLDQLMNLVGELVLTRNQMLQAMGGIEDPILMSTSQSLDQVTSELQDKIMRTRMQPIGNIFNKFPRVVRDLSRQLGKQIDLVVNGRETELDRTILEAMRDPFTHILRNSIDHGIEMPDKRRAAGKRETGTVTISSYHEGGQVIVEVVDDGGGIDARRVADKAIAKGLVTPQQVEAMSEQEMVMLVTAPGLSTAESITNISGRGVGMDVVRSNIEKIGGSLEIASELGRGTTIRIKIPLTLAIIPALMVGAGGQLFGIPQINLVELVGVPTEELEARIETVRGAEVYRLREKLLTIVRPRDVLDLPDAPVDQTAAMAFIVVVAAGDQQFGLLVEDIYDTEEIVVKPLSPHLDSIEQFAGATIRGDGRVCLILDMAGLARANRIDNGGTAETRSDDETNSGETDNEFLVFGLGCREQFALPLALVARIEQYRAGDLTQVNGNDVICHDGHILPVVLIDQLTDARAAELDPDAPIFAIVLNHRLQVAIMAHELVDSMTIDLEDVLGDRDLLRSKAVNGLVVVGDRPTALLDAHVLVDLAYPPAVEEAAVYQHGDDAPITVDGHQATGRVLYAEDAQFFQKVVRGYLEEAGLTVDVVDHGEAAWQVLQREADTYDLLLTDLEMPIMDGWDLIKTVRSMPQYDRLPILALTSLSDEAVRQRTLQFGASDFVVKLDRGQLLDRIRSVMANRIGV